MTYTIPLTRVSDKFLAKFTFHEQESKVLEEAGELFAASRALDEANEKSNLRNWELDELSRRFADELVDLCTAALGLAAKHGVTEDMLREASERNRRRNQQRGRL